MPICINNASLVYSPGTPFASHALREITLTINQGEFVGLIGHTGSGKSSLIQLMNGLIQPTSGEVIVDGINLRDKRSDLKRVRQRVGLVFQYPEHQLFEETVAKEIAFGLRQLRIDEAEQERRIREALQLVNLDPTAMLDRSPFELSGGQMRRIALASVLAMHPEYLILDEPTAGLDPQGRDDILRQVQALHKKRSMAVVLVSHSMEDVGRVASRVLVMCQGRLAMEGKPENLFAEAERLRSMGLDIPQVTDLMQRLRSQGLPVNANAVTLQQAHTELAKWLRSRKR